MTDPLIEAMRDGMGGCEAGGTPLVGWCLRLPALRLRQAGAWMEQAADRVFALAKVKRHRMCFFTFLMAAPINRISTWATRG